MKSSRGRRGKHSRSRRPLLILAIGMLAIVATTAYLLLFYLPQQDALAGSSATSLSSTSSPPTQEEWKILYVNQGNALVDESNFSALVTTVKSHGFNTIFFQVYRSGVLLFTSNELSYFVATAHTGNISFFFSLYFTDSSQKIPSSIFNLGEDGISLDMSTLPLSSQLSLLSTLRDSYHGGKTAVTTTDFSTTLKPDLLILETYSPADRQYLHQGVIGGVEVLATANRQDYEQQIQYSLANSDGVMVFDYYGLALKGY
ncbi:MAG TPA: hypothetical protein VFF30_06400 [Nitrososphaerales archaeon]|nr:hypothetical protein [Nitrososphaerales archaeon]